MEWSSPEDAMSGVCILLHSLDAYGLSKSLNRVPDCKADAGRFYWLCR
jgi:hypothetical protein